MANGVLVVRGASSLVNQLEVKMRFVPHVMLATAKDGYETQPSAKLSVLHCPMSIVSGPPVRNNDAAKVVVRLQGGCARDLRSVRFTTERGPLPVLQSVDCQDATYVLLGLGNLSEEALTLTAMRGEPDSIALAVARTATRPAPRVRASIEVPGFPNLGFIPNNRGAVVHISAASEHEAYALLPIDGVYRSDYHEGVATIRGDPNAAGLTELHFGLHNRALPPPLDQANLAEADDPLQRSIHEANIPTPIGADAGSKNPLVEMLCGAGKNSRAFRSARPSTCRSSCAIRVACCFTASASHTSTARRSQLRGRGDSPRTGPRAATRTCRRWSRCAADPSRATRGFTASSISSIAWSYASRTRPMKRTTWAPNEIKTGAPALQWSAVLGTGHVRLYGTTAIPTGLYRFSDKAHSGVLSLNFGVISRLTWLDSEGHEGFLGAEGGIMVHRPRQLDERNRAVADTSRRRARSRLRAFRSRTGR